MTNLKKIGCAAILFFSILSSFQVQATRSGKFNIVGIVVSFDDKIVSVKSGKTIYDFPKNELKFPSFKVGSKIEIPTSDENIKKLRSRVVKR